MDDALHYIGERSSRRTIATRSSVAGAMVPLTMSVSGYAVMLQNAVVNYLGYQSEGDGKLLLRLRRMGAAIW